MWEFLSGMIEAFAIFISVIGVFFILGLIIGYVIETIEKRKEKENV